MEHTTTVPGGDYSGTVGFHKGIRIAGYINAVVFIVIGVILAITANPDWPWPFFVALWAYAAGLAGHYGVRIHSNMAKESRRSWFIGAYAASIVVDRTGTAAPDVKRITTPEDYQLIMESVSLLRTTMKGEK